MPCRMYALKDMSGEELQLLRIVYGEAKHAEGDEELDRRAEAGYIYQPNIEAFWAGRTLRMARASQIAV